MSASSEQRGKMWDRPGAPGKAHWWAALGTIQPPISRVSLLCFVPGMQEHLNSQWLGLSQALTRAQCSSLWVCSFFLCGGLWFRKPRGCSSICHGVRGIHHLRLLPCWGHPASEFTHSGELRALCKTLPAPPLPGAEELEVLPALCGAAPARAHAPRVTLLMVPTAGQEGCRLDGISFRGHYKDGQLFWVWQKSIAPCSPRKRQTCWKMVTVCHQKRHGRAAPSDLPQIAAELWLLFPGLRKTAALTLLLTWSLFVAPLQCKDMVQDRRHSATEAWNPSNVLLVLYCCFLQQPSETLCTVDSCGPVPSADRHWETILTPKSFDENKWDCVKIRGN